MKSRPKKTSKDRPKENRLLKAREQLEVSKNKKSNKRKKDSSKKHSNKPSPTLSDFAASDNDRGAFKHFRQEPASPRMEERPRIRVRWNSQVDNKIKRNYRKRMSGEGRITNFLEK